MKSHRPAQRGVILSVVLAVGIGLSISYARRNILSSTTILGRWNNVGPERANNFIPTMTFRPNGVVDREPDHPDANYLVHGHVVVFYNIRSKNAAVYPVVWDTSIVGDTLTIGEGKNAGVFRRVQ